MEFLIISGLSGAGKSQINRLVEDMGYYAVDNMPAELFPSFAELCTAAGGRYDRVALVTDVRAGQDFSALFAALHILDTMNCAHKILFVEARPDTILRRYKETRRRHPLARPGEPLPETLRRELELLRPLRRKADYIVDTTALSPSALQNHIAGLLTDGKRRPMTVTALSFGFKYGIPLEADLVFDVRFLPNPFHEPELRRLSGLDEPVRDYVRKFPQTAEFLQKLDELTGFLLPQYMNEGRTGLVVAVGCTGGRHRSVAIAQALYDALTGRGYYAVLTHRDIGLDPEARQLTVDN